MHNVLVYLGILLGIFFEGEMTMISAVLAVHTGYLNIYIVFTLGIIGTFGSDCFYFWFGRRKGKIWLNKRPKYKERAIRMNKKLMRSPLLVFISYRFLYGFRTVAPIIIGTSGITNNKFLFYSFVSTMIWAIIYTILGYKLGDVMASALGHIEHFEKYIIASLIFIGVLIMLFRYIRKNKKYLQAKNPN
jgi:membrane protein DedA with SNARE-associated domain